MNLTYEVICPTFSKWWLFSILTLNSAHAAVIIYYMYLPIYVYMYVHVYVQNIKVLM